jgi:hypothetical protein
MLDGLLRKTPHLDQIQYSALSHQQAGDVVVLKVRMALPGDQAVALGLVTVQLKQVVQGLPVKVLLVETALTLMRLLLLAVVVVARGP